MATIPTFEKLGLDAPQPAAGVASYRATSGAETAPGEALAAEGTQIQSEGDKLWHLAKIEQEKHDTVAVEDAWNQYKNHALDLTMGDNGLLKTQGADAVNGKLFDKAGAAQTTAKQAILENLTPDQQTRFSQRADITDLNVKHQILSHIVQEQQKYATTTMAGTDAASNAQVAADPTSTDTFISEHNTLMNQADVYLKHNGITNKGSIDAYKDKLTDGLWETRINSLLSMNQPLAADALFRENAGQIKNPVLRMQLRNKTQEGAVVMNANLRADAEVTGAIARLVQQQAAPAAERATPEGGPARPGEKLSVSERQNNPGNIVDPATGVIRTFATREEGDRALEGELRLKLSGQSPAYQRRFGNQPVTPERLAETWAPAAANGNSQESTTNYGNAIATALGIGPQDPIPNTPQAIQQVKGAITSFEAGGSGGMRKVSSTTLSSPQYDTSGMPNARDIAAQLGPLMATGEKHATELYGANVADPARMAFMKHYESDIKAKLGAKVAQLTALQKDALDDVSDFVQGLKPQGAPGAGGMLTTAAGGRAGGPGMVRITSIPELQSASPEMFAKFQRLDAVGKNHIVVLMEQAQRADEKGTPALYNEYRNRINLPPDDPNKVNWIQTISQDPRVVSGGLSQSQWTSLRTELKDSATDEGRSQAGAKASGERLVRAMYQGDMILTAAGTNKGNADYAQELWARNADKIIGQYKQQNKDIRPLFDPTPGNKDSLVTKEAIAQFAVQAGAAATGGQALATGAANVTTGKAQPIADQKPPATPKTEADYNALPPGTVYVDPNGKQRQKPGAPPAPLSSSSQSIEAPTAVASSATAGPDVADLRADPTAQDTSKWEKRPDGTAKGMGFLGLLKTPDGKVASEYSVGVQIGGKEMDIPTLVPTLTRPEVEQVLQGKVSDAVVRKAQAFAEQRIKEGKPVFATAAESPGSTPRAPQQTMDENGKIVTPPPVPVAVKPEDDIPALDDTQDKPKYSRTSEQWKAQQTRSAVIGDNLAAAIKTGQWLLLQPLVAVARGVMGTLKVVESLNPPEEQRAATQVRAIFKGDQKFRANESTLLSLNNFLASKKAPADGGPTDIERRKAQKMATIVAQKLGVLDVPEAP